MTYHSIQRTKERTGLSTSASINFISKAKRFGLSPDFYPSKERAYLHGKEYLGTSTLCYGEYIFIFSEEGLCLTMYPMPKWFCQSGRFDGKERIRNRKKYLRLHAL